MDRPTIQKRLAESRTMLAAAAGRSARASHQGLVLAYEALLAKRRSPAEALEDEVARLRAGGEEYSDLTSDAYRAAPPR